MKKLYIYIFAIPIIFSYVVKYITLFKYDLK